jgi:regulatory protein
MEALSFDLALGEAVPSSIHVDPESPAGEGSDGTFAEAMHKAGTLLSRRARTEHELRERLLAAGFGARVVGRAVDRLKALRLLDDLAFARAWIAERSGRKGLAGRALLDELIAKGVAPETAEQALSDAGLDEEAMARVWAARLLPRLSRLPLPAQAARLEAALARRGFSEEAVETGVRAVLPPEGWD